MTRSPTLKPLACAPTSMTSPEYSLPIGVPTAAPWLALPLAAPRSARLSAIALTLTRRSAGFGFGAGTSRTTRPCSLDTAAFIDKLHTYELRGYPTACALTLSHHGQVPGIIS